ncbi:MAG TPA: hypothetical protein H9902_13140 [Candidatus Stackebrandtia faecavium]|nr:hypothetical protein [Candidatus Stackebrandtia faecavium]
MNGDVNVELEKLWRAGAVDLPQAAAAFQAGATEIEQSREAADAAFKRSGGGMGSLYPEWEKLRNTLQANILTKSHENLLKAGETLTHIANDFVAGDEELMAELRNIQQNAEEVSDDLHATGPDSAASVNVEQQTRTHGQ